MSDPTQRLMRSRNEKIIAGVAGGIAQYLAVDPVLVRLAFVALGISGIGVIVYPVLWLIMPPESGTSTKTPRAVAQIDREQFVTLGNTRRPRFDPMTGQPLEEGEEIPINNVGGGTPQSNPQLRRNRLLGFILVGVGVIIAVNTIAPWMSQFVVPALFIAGGILLLRRAR